MTVYKGDKIISGSVPDTVDKSLSNINSTGQAKFDEKVNYTDIWYDSNTLTLYIGVPQT